MKKIYALLCIIFIISVTSCGKESETTFNNGNKDIIKNESVTPEETVFLEEDISNQPYTKVQEMIKTKNQQLKAESFIIEGKGNKYSINFKDFDYELDEKTIIKNIENNKKDNFAYTYSEEKLIELIEGIYSAENIAFKDASIIREGGEFKIIDGVKGSVVSKENLENDLISILELKNNKITLVYDETNPKYSANDFSGFVAIGKFESKYKTYDTNRNINLAQASSRINNVVLYPNEVFSTNDHYGITSVENGYAVANVIVNNELVDGLGGGVCQISSNLYNAVLQAELEITERRNHSLPVSYVPLGLDATLANPYIDFKFRNDQDTPILITAYISDGIANVTIYGKEIHEPSRSLQFRSSIISSTPAGEVRKEDDSLYIGEQVFDVTPLNGLVVETYKDIYNNGKLVDTVFVAKSNYSTRDAVIRVGTKEPVKAPDPIVTEKPTLPETPVPETPIPETPIPETPVVPETPVENIPEVVNPPIEVGTDTETLDNVTENNQTNS